MEGKCKVIAVGDGGGSAHAKCYQAKGGMENGSLLGANKLLLCGAIDAPADANAPVKLWNGGENAYLYAHTGTPFKQDTGKTVEHLGNTFINAMDFSPEAKVLIVVTGDKRIIAYNSDDDSKLCEKTDAHKKGIYDVKWVSADTFMTVSGDNLIKSWKWNGEAKTIEEVESIQQTAGESEEV